MPSQSFLSLVNNTRKRNWESSLFRLTIVTIPRNKRERKKAEKDKEKETHSQSQILPTLSFIHPRRLKNF
jgi:hypothetical protein